MVEVHKSYATELKSGKAGSNSRTSEFYSSSLPTTTEHLKIRKWCRNSYTNLHYISLSRLDPGVTFITKYLHMIWVIYCECISCL